MANTTNWTPVNTPVTVKQPNKKASSTSVVVQGAKVQTMKGKAVRVQCE